MTQIPGSQSHLARCVSAEVRARIAATRSSGIELAKQIGRSQNYVATRLRDEKPFTLDDVEAIVDALGMVGTNPDEFIAQAVERNSEEVSVQLLDLEIAANPRRPHLAPAPTDLVYEEYGEGELPEDIAALRGRAREEQTSDDA